MTQSQPEEVNPVVDTYDGPWIEKRIEWICDTRKQAVELFGSWNGFKGGDELEYQGHNTYAVTVKLPLGNHVYRFLIDGEDWETSHDDAKAIRDGFEYNTITIKANNAESSEDEEEPKKNNEEDAPEQILTFDESTGGFVVGKGKKKRRGRPSIEIELPANFVESPTSSPQPNQEQAQPQQTQLHTELASVPEKLESVPEKLESVSEKPKATNTEKSTKSRRKRRSKMKGFGLPVNVDMQQVVKEKEEEWARQAFVQQLRQQQQHDDEIDRLKTLWKQERQVRVEMQKRIQTRSSELEQKVVELSGEIEKLKKQAEIQTGGDTKQATLLEEELKKKNQEIGSKLEETKSLREQITNLRKEKMELEKNTRRAGDLENEKRGLTNDLNRLQTELKALQQQNEVLRKNAESSTEIKHVEIQKSASLQANWEDEKKELLKYKDDLKKLKAELSEKAAEIQKELEAKLAAEQVLQLEKNKNESLQQKLKDLEKQVTGLDDKSKSTAAIQASVEKEKNDLINEKKTLEEKIDVLEKRINSQKANFEQELVQVKAQTKADLDALCEKSDKESTSRLEVLRLQIVQKDDEIRASKDKLVKFEDQLTEVNNLKESLTKRLTSLTEEAEAGKKEKESWQSEKSDLLANIEKLRGELKDKESLAQNEQNLTTTKISNLERELASQKEKSTLEINGLEESNRKITEQLEQMKKELVEKLSEIKKATDEKETLRNTESTLKTQLQSLNEQLGKEREEMQNSLKVKDARIDELSGQMEKSLSEKDQKITGLEERLADTQKTLEQKLSESQNAQTTIEKLTHEIQANASQYEREKALYEKRIAAATSKDEKMMKKCKDILQTFTTMQKEMSEIRRAKIEELEKTNEFFPSMKDTLTRAFGLQQNLVDGLMEKYKSELTLRRKYFNMLQDLRGNIRVFCRVRPLLPFEIKKGYGECITFPSEGALQIKDDKDQLLKFEFDQVYVPQTTQEQVSVDTTEYIQSVMDGYNVSIFAYGQTGSGKTFTMNGPSDNPGVNLRALKNLFKLAEDRKPMFQYEIQVSIFEIYNEEVRDLLAGVDKGKKKKKDEKAPAKKEKVQHKILHLPDGSVEVTNLNWINVESDKDVIELDEIAKSNRTAGVTDMNAHSSRSHMLLVVDVKGFNVAANIQYLGKLYLVDLAGSERVKKSGATGQALLEAQNINQSLSALGNVMQALQQKKFVPYRDSTLTDIMTNALGGNAKTVMFINCCPTAEHAFETVSSLKFAERVGKVELGQAKQQKTTASTATKKVVKPAAQT